MSAVSVPARGRRRLPHLDLLGSARPTVLELAVALAALAAVGGLVYGSHVLSGGFYYDDWANAALHRYSGDSVGAFWDLTSYRPLLALYVPLTHEVFGAHFGLHLAWAVALAVLMSACLFLVLRLLGMQRLHAAAIATLVLVFPYSDSTRLWATSSMAHLSISFYLLGTAAAIAGIRGRRPLLHAGAVVLYALSVLTYEIAAGPILLSVLLYAALTRPRPALARWGADLAVVGPLLLLVTREGGRETGGLEDHLDHARRIADEGADVFSASLFPFGAPPGPTALALSAAVALAALAVRRALPQGDPERAALGAWLLAALGGFVAALAGWLVFVPADPYYSPLTLGVGNRTNVLAAIGLVVLVYALLVLLVRLVFRGLGSWGPRVPFVAAALGAVIGAGYIDTVGDDKAAYDEAYRIERRVLDAVVSTVPDPPPGSTIYTFNHPAFLEPGVPVFAATWDLNGAVRLQLGDPSLSAFPAFAGTTFVCRDDALHPEGNGYGPAQGEAYGRTFFVDVNGGRTARIFDRRSCVDAVASFQPGPFELTSG